MRDGEILAAIHDSPWEREAEEWRAVDFVVTVDESEIAPEFLASEISDVVNMLQARPSTDGSGWRVE